MSLEKTKERIKEHEGFRDTVYKDSLGKATIGYGHLITRADNFIEDVQYSKEELNNLFESDFETACDQAMTLISNFNICETAQGVIIEMVFQLGIGGVSKFKSMLAALNESNYTLAAEQMINSNWHKQTPKRCEELAKIMKSCAEVN